MNNSCYSLAPLRSSSSLSSLSYSVQREALALLCVCVSPYFAVVFVWVLSSADCTRVHVLSCVIGAVKCQRSATHIRHANYCRASCGTNN